MSEEIEVHESSGNIWADLGYPDAEERMAKATISILIERTIETRGWTQEQAAEVLGTTQPKVSDLVRGKLAGFSMERLFRFLNALGHDVQITAQDAEAGAPAGGIMKTDRGRPPGTRRPYSRSPHGS